MRGRVFGGFLTLGLSVILSGCGNLFEQDQAQPQSKQVAMPLSQIFPQGVLDHSLIKGEVKVDNVSYIMGELLPAQPGYWGASVQLEPNTTPTIEIKFIYDHFNNTFDIPIAYGKRTVNYTGGGQAINIPVETKPASYPNDFNMDMDGDTYFNYEEIIANTDPNLATEHPASVTTTAIAAGTAPFTATTTVSLSCNPNPTDCGSIYYNTEAVDAAYQPYSSAIPITYTTTIYHYATDVDGNPGTISNDTFNFAITGKVLFPTPNDIATKAGVQVTLYKVGATGNSAGPVNTDQNGNFSIITPPGVIPDYLGYGLNASVSDGYGNTSSLRGAVHGRTNNEVSPYSDAAVTLIGQYVSTPANFSKEESQLLLKLIRSLFGFIDFGAAQTSPDPVAAVAAQLLSAAEELEYGQLVLSMQSPGEICGNVTDETGAAADGMHIVARDFNTRLLRGVAESASGKYCMNLPFGDYFMGAMNRQSNPNNVAVPASAWWASQGLQRFRLDAEKINLSNDPAGGNSIITIADSTTTDSINFSLPTGYTISGRVTGGGNPLASISVEVKDFYSGYPIASAQTDKNGQYNISVGSGDYLLEAINQTPKAFASDYLKPARLANMNGQVYAELLNVDITGLADKNIALPTGAGSMRGKLVDGTGAAVPGARVMLDKSTGGPVHRVRSNSKGNYAIWLASDNYTLRTQGQTVANIQPQLQNITVTTVAKTVTVVDSQGIGVSKVKLRPFSQNGTAWTYEGTESTRSDGKGTVYLVPGQLYAMAQRIDWIPTPAAVKQLTFASQVYQGPGGAYALSLDTGTALQSIDKVLYSSTQNTDAAVLRGTVIDANSQGIPNATIVILVTGGTLPSNRFIGNRTRSDGSFLTVVPRTDPVTSTLLTYDVRVSEPGGTSTTCSVPLSASGGVRLDVTKTLLSTLSCSTTALP